jgi:hypothetical protein
MKPTSERIIEIAERVKLMILEDGPVDTLLLDDVTRLMLSKADVIDKIGLSPLVMMSGGSYSLYTHHKADSGQLFYVGICKDSRLKIRPGEKYNRSRFWKRIEVKHGRKYSIILTGVSKDFIFATERWLISLFGKRNNGGILCNITDGGDGLNGANQTKESRLKMSLAKKGRTGYLCHNSHAVMCEGVEYGSMAEAGRSLGLNTQTISNRVNNTNRTDYYKL